MEFKKFEVLSIKDNQAEEESNTQILFNVDHIVSLKPIKFVYREVVIDGFWIRLTNGKKYRAVKIPEELGSMFDT